MRHKVSEDHCCLSVAERNFEMTTRSNRTEAEPPASFGKHLRAIPFLFCPLVLFFTTSATAQSAPPSPGADSIVWGVYDNFSGEWVVWGDDSVDVNSVVWGEDGSDPDATSPDSVVWGIQ